MEVEAVLADLEAMGDPEARAGMGRFGINVERAHGIKVTDLRRYARKLGKDHALAAALWDTGVHEARILASIVDEPDRVTPEQMDEWAAGFDSWDLVDQCCGNLFDKTPRAYDKAFEWSERDEEFVKRAAFALMAWLAVHDKKADDERFLTFLPVIESEASDDRNFVKKAVNWALRQMGKRSPELRDCALEACDRIEAQNTRSARWIARNARKELTAKRL